MVNRLQENEALIVDLDGTLISRNSFTLFVKWLGRAFVSRRRYKALMQLCRYVAERKMRLISHARCKQLIIDLVQRNLSETEMDAFGESLSAYLRPLVMDIITEARREGRVCVLATAAPGIYAKAFGRKVGMDCCIATSGGEKECKGDEKLRRINDLLRERGLKLWGVITDHHDDLPLMRVAGIKRWLVAPSAETVKKMREKDVDFAILRIK